MASCMAVHGALEAVRYRFDMRCGITRFLRMGSVETHMVHQHCSAEFGGSEPNSSEEEGEEDAIWSIARRRGRVLWVQ